MLAHVISYWLIRRAITAGQEDLAKAIALYALASMTQGFFELARWSAPIPPFAQKMSHFLQKMRIFSSAVLVVSVATETAWCRPIPLLFFAASGAILKLTEMGEEFAQVAIYCALWFAM